MPEKRPEPSFEFVQLLTSHQSRLYAYVLSLLGDRTQADDVLQETNSVLWRKANEFELGTNFGAWMLKVAYFQVMAHRRRLTRDRLVFDDDFLQDIAEDAKQQCEWQSRSWLTAADSPGIALFSTMTSFKTSLKTRSSSASGREKINDVWATASENSLNGIRNSSAVDTPKVPL